ncbi:DUF6207 family protein [Streptomyces sp. NPDC020792]|uniref:DUF6207 family protein n=1 Tax=Streptomyces sp. NPDC020792 TaxID=3365089 RepID=UPI003794A107
MRQINDAHVAVPGLAVVEVAVADDETAFAVQELLAARCAVAPTERTTREPDEPGGRMRFYRLTVGRDMPHSTGVESVIHTVSCQ